MKTELITIMENLNDNDLLFSGIEEDEITEKMEFFNKYGNILSNYKEED